MIDELRRQTWIERARYERARKQTRWTWMEKARSVRKNPRLLTASELRAKLAALREETDRRVKSLAKVFHDPRKPAADRIRALLELVEWGFELPVPTEDLRKAFVDTQDESESMLALTRLRRALPASALLHMCDYAPGSESLH